MPAATSSPTQPQPPREQDTADFQAEATPGRWHALARHGLRNAAVPVVAILGIELATSLLGAVVIENVFALPGLGTLLLDSVTSRDLPVVQALVLLLTAVVLVTNTVVDLGQRAIDPRLRLAKEVAA